MLLNDEQRKFCTDNHKLIYKFMSIKHLDENDIEDWYGTCAVALCRASASYNESLGIKFSVYAFKCMQNEMIRKFTKKQLDYTSIEALTYCSEDGDGISISQALADVCCMEDYIIITSVMCDVYDKLKDNHKDMIKLRFKYDYQFNDIAKIHNCSRQNVHKIVTKYLKDVKDMLIEKI